MNNTNRALNRSVLVMVGLLLLAVAAVLALLATQTTTQQVWTSVAETARSTVSGWFQATPLSGTQYSWLWIIALALLVAVAGLLLGFILRQGGGHSGLFLSE